MPAVAVDGPAAKAGTEVSAEPEGDKDGAGQTVAKRKAKAKSAEAGASPDDGKSVPAVAVDGPAAKTGAEVSPEPEGTKGG
eukprot:CAMPEP_0178993538 /NCGR_PEP_ID=MMETSP0795-20121207/6756_1 /TAXON_ID=88552 /ORGANISM="Amoebophrya sp., Strain Ameob2" /LENGTH=80 /DNA_ID=CAMNT_0020685603 /DNA_START=8 /DNA_END=246 /DNA_ORIENTATION=+